MQALCGLHAGLTQTSSERCSAARGFGIFRLVSTASEGIRSDGEHPRNGVPPGVLDGGLSRVFLPPSEMSRFRSNSWFVVIVCVFR